MYKQIFVSENFITKESDLMGKLTEHPIRSESFIREAGMKIIEATDNKENIAYMLNDYARTLKAIIKQELLNEMISRVENINTFYR